VEGTHARYDTHEHYTPHDVCCAYMKTQKFGGKKNAILNPQESSMADISFCARLSNQLPGSLFYGAMLESDHFRFLHGTCLHNLKGSVGIILTKVSIMRISIPVDLSSRSFIPLPRFIRSRRPIPL